MQSRGRPGGGEAAWAQGESGRKVSPSCPQSSQATAQRRAGLLDPGSCLYPGQPCPALGEITDRRGAGQSPLLPTSC